ncbi:MAG: leucyl/phenylalanyl-tRNA--protein transferase [Deltaproteobacteria bacterium]|nr:leucyl/phenylalanyl-tRNA--protein transferase [Deltaproteobacteria bacterium]
MAIFPDDLEPDETGLVALGGELHPEILIEAYTKGIFPWTGAHPIPWYSPDPRMVLRPQSIHISRSMKKLLRRERFEVRFDSCFPEVMRRCKGIKRRHERGTWITPNMLVAYGKLHEMGVTHSVETFENGKLVGGLYGVAIGRAFFGESMFAAVDNASKIALISLCRRLATRRYLLVDCQQVTDHLTFMGGSPMPRRQFLDLLGRAVRGPSQWEAEPDPLLDPLLAAGEPSGS